MSCWRKIGLMFVAFATCVDAADYVPKPNEYPPIDAGVYLAGELVFVDPSKECHARYPVFLYPPSLTCHPPR